MAVFGFNFPFGQHAENGNRDEQKLKRFHVGALFEIHAHSAQEAQVAFFEGLSERHLIKLAVREV